MTQTLLDRFRLDGRVALITGGSKGLGLAIAHALAEAGADVAILSRHGDEAKQVAGEISTASGRRALGVQADVTQASDVSAALDAVIQQLGGLHILVNSAGINIRKPLVEFDSAEWRRVLEVNVMGTMEVCRLAGPHLLAQRYGRVINLSSIMGSVALPGRTPYTASKGAVIQFTRALALEWAEHGVTVNALCPGPFATAMNQTLIANPEQNQFFVSRIPLGRWGEPEEITGAALFLAADASSFTTGSCLYVDGGWTAQ